MQHNTDCINPILCRPGNDSAGASGILHKIKDTFTGTETSAPTPTK